MIGTLIIAVVGYGMALFAGLTAFGSLIDYHRREACTLEETQAGLTSAIATACALTFAALTRWLTGY